MGIDTVFKITAAVTGANAVKELSKEIKGISSAGENAERRMALLTRAAKAFAIGYGLNEIRQFSREVINLGDELHDLSERTGIASETLSGMRVSAQLGGVSLDTLATGVKKLNINMADAAGGGKDTAAIFKNIGISVTDASGRIKSADKVILDIADKFKQWEDGANKTAIAVKIFGKAGDQMIPFLNQGREAIEKFAKPLSGEFIDAADEFNDQLALIGATATQAGAEVLSGLLPSINAILDGFNETDESGNEVNSMLVIMKGALEGVGEIARLVTVDVMAVAEALNQTAKFGGMVLAVGYAATNSDSDIKDVWAEYKRSAGASLDSTMAAGTKVMQGGLLWGASGLNEPAVPGTTTKKDAPNIVKPAGADAAAKAHERALKAADEYLRKQGELNETLMMESEYIGKSTNEINKMKTAREAQLGAQEKIKDLTPQEAANFLELTDAITAARLEIIDFNYQQSRTFETGAQNAFAKYIEDAGNVAKQSEELFTDAFKGMEDAMVEFTKTGKLNFKSLASSIIDDLIRMQIQASIVKPLSGLLGSLGGMFGGSSGGFGGDDFDMLFGEDVFAFANGGIMSRGGSVPLRKYAAGGVANSPQLAMFGEGSKPEAYVPLPDGRRIPVAMQGGAGGGDIYLNLTVNATTGEESGSGGDGNANKLAQTIVGVVKQTLIKEKRNGGLLA